MLELAPAKRFLPLLLTSLVASPNEAQGITKQSAFVLSLTLASGC